MFRNLLQDVRCGIRVLLRSPGFTIVAILSLALGIGANTAIFTVINAVFLNPLPVKDPSRLVQVFTVDNRTASAAAFTLTPSSLPNYQDYRDQNNVFDGFAAETPFGFPLTWTGQTTPVQLPAVLVSANYFDVLGVPAYRGRTFFPDEDKNPGANPIVVLSYGLWTTSFGSDEGIVGKTITLNGQPYSVVGVAPPSFKGTGLIAAPNQLWVPYSMRDFVLSGPARKFEENRRFRWLNMVGRLKPGVNIKQAESALKTIASALEKQYPNENGGRTVSLATLSDSALGINNRRQFSMVGGMLMAIVGLVLLIACANLANLLLAQAAKREKELSVRAAMGASRVRLVRQLLTESILLSIAGGAAGLAVAYEGTKVLWANRPPFLPDGTFSLSLDPRVLFFTLGVSVITGILFGVVPAIKSSSPNLMQALKVGGRTGNSSGQHNRVRSILVGAEVALALIALVGAGLFLRSMQNAQKIDLGFESKNLMILTLDLGGQHYSTDRGQQFFKDATDKLRAVPGVVDAAVSTGFPLGGSIFGTVFREGEQNNPNSHGALMTLESVTPSYFNTVRIPLISGRTFTEFDRDQSLPIAVLNEAAAAALWPGQEPINKRFAQFGNPVLFQVVGVVKNSVVATIGETPQPVVYYPMGQQYAAAVVLHVRTASAPDSLVGSIKDTVQQLDRSIPLTNVNTIGQLIDNNLWASRMGAALLGIFGALALALAMIGVYGVMAYSVTQRTGEIGIRMALGAQARDVLGLVIGQGITVVAIGAIVGNILAFLLARFMVDLLYQVHWYDPITFASVTAILALVALAACYIPARRATRVDPLVALRFE